MKSEDMTEEQRVLRAALNDAIYELQKAVAAVENGAPVAGALLVRHVITDLRRRRDAIYPGNGAKP